MNTQSSYVPPYLNATPEEKVMGSPASSRTIRAAIAREAGKPLVIEAVTLGAPRPNVSTPNFFRIKFNVCRNAPAPA